MLIAFSLYIPKQFNRIVWRFTFRPWLGSQRVRLKKFNILPPRGWQPEKTAAAACHRRIRRPTSTTTEDRNYTEHVAWNALTPSEDILDLHLNWQPIRLRPLLSTTRPTPPKTFRASILNGGSYTYTYHHEKRNGWNWSGLVRRKAPRKPVRQPAIQREMASRSTWVWAGK